MAKNVLCLLGHIVHSFTKFGENLPGRFGEIRFYRYTVRLKILILDQSCGLVVRVSALQLGDRGSIPG